MPPRAPGQTLPARSAVRCRLLDLYVGGKEPVAEHTEEAHGTRNDRFLILPPFPGATEAWNQSLPAQDASGLSDTRASWARRPTLDEDPTGAGRPFR